MISWLRTGRRGNTHSVIPPTKWQLASFWEKGLLQFPEEVTGPLIWYPYCLVHGLPVLDGGRFKTYE